MALQMGEFGEMRRGSTTRRVAAKRTIGVLAILTFGYAAAPYVCLWRVYHAVQSGDAATLAQVVDWNAVRQGMKQDIAEGIIGLPAPQSAASDSLPAFGSGFVAGIAGTVVDQQVTPQHLVAAVHDLIPVAGPRAPAPGIGIGSLERAFFTSPTCFVVRIRLPDAERGDAPLRVELDLGRGGWKVVRAWIPQDLMDEAKFHT
jgi:hypothetical protein